MVHRLFERLLHREEWYLTTFAARGTSDRTGALCTALVATRERYIAHTGVTPRPYAIQVTAASPVQCPCLQATDYFLWALQRLYERREDRFVRLLWPTFRLVIDADDVRTTRRGVYYTQSNPLTRESIAEAPGI
jgi:hypothetical protein